MSLLTQTIQIFLMIMYYAIFIRIILSWLPIPRDNFIIQGLYNFTEPVLSPFRRLLDKSPIGGTFLDFSPVLAIILIQFLITIL